MSGSRSRRGPASSLIAGVVPASRARAGPARPRRGRPAGPACPGSSPRRPRGSTRASAPAKSWNCAARSTTCPGRVRLGGALVRELRPVVAGVRRDVDADDRQHDAVRAPRRRWRPAQVRGHGREERGRLTARPGSCCSSRRHGVHAGEVEARPAREVDARSRATARRRRGPRAGGVGERAADEAGGSGDGDAHGVLLELGYRCPSQFYHLGQELSWLRMKLSQGVEWGVHCCVVLARPRAPVPAARLAEYHGISPTLPGQAPPGARARRPGPLDAGTGRRLRAHPRRAARSRVLDVVAAIDGDEPAFRCTEIRQRGPLATPPERCLRPCAIARAMARPRTRGARRCAP